MVRTGVDDIAFDDAPASFMRAMLRVGGRLFADMANDIRVSSTLQYLCDATCDLLGADEVSLHLHDDAFGLFWMFESSHPSGAPDPGPVRLVAQIAPAETAPLGELRISWIDPERAPSALDENVATRFAAMALLAVERHLAKRRQMQAIALEREALAGEIHDDPLQVMTAVSLQLQRAAARLDDAEDRAAIQQARVLNDHAIERLRYVMFSAHPMTLLEDGLAASIEAYSESFVEVEGLTWTLNGKADDVPFEIAALAFRLCRNALVNVIEHAQATTVAIELDCSDGVVRIEIRDDGVGFNLAQIRHTKVGHLGIPHAVTLARWAGGSYTTTSGPTRGTTVTIELPII